jgi:hypothetical protein
MLGSYDPQAKEALAKDWGRGEAPQARWEAEEPGRMPGTSYCADLS